MIIHQVREIVPKPSYFARNKLFCLVSLDHSYNKPNRFNNSMGATKSHFNDLSWLKPKNCEEFPLLKTEKILTKSVISPKSLIWTFIHNNLKTEFHFFSSRILTPKINQRSSPVFLDTGTAACEALTTRSRHHRCRLYSRRVTHRGTPEDRLPAASSQNHATECSSSWAQAADAWMFRRFLLLTHKPAPFIKDHPPSRKMTSMHNCKLGRGTATSGGKGQFRTGEQSSRTRLDVTLVAQHRSGRETEGGRRRELVQARAHTPAREPGGRRHTAKFCNFWQSLLLLPHHSLPVERWDLKAAKTTKKSNTSSFSLSAFLLYEQTWRKREIQGKQQEGVVILWQRLVPVVCTSLEDKNKWKALKEQHVVI